MPQVSYLVRTQVIARLSNPTTGFNYQLATACSGQEPSPQPYSINWQIASPGNQSAGSSSFWQSNVTTEDLDRSSAPGDCTICLVYGVGFSNMTGTVQKFAVFSGTVEIGVEFDLAWAQADIPVDTEGLADATDGAMIQTFNAAAYYSSFGNGVLYNGLIRCDRGPLRESGPGWRQRLPYRITFEVQV